SQLRAGLRSAVAGLPEAERGLVPALVVGDESGLPERLVDDFRTAGLSHLTAVSGANFTIVLAFVLGLARWAGVRSWGLPLLGVVCALGFVVLARPEPSVLRAAAMGLVGLAGLAAGSRRYGVPALALAVVALLLADPWLGRSFGFALSVIATAGILLLTPAYTAALSRWLPRFAAAAVAVPLAAQLACTPVVALLSGSVSVVAVVANFVAAPAVLPATVFGLVATLVAPFSVAVASVPGFLAGVSARWIVEVGTLAAQAPGASLSWPVGGPGIVVLIALCGAGVVAAPALLGRRVVSLVLAGAAAVWIVHPVRVPVPTTWLTGWPPRGWIMVACDVGQGDAIVLRSGPRTGVVVDTGPDPARMDACLTGLGITRVPYVLLSHFHDDHIAGLDGVVRGRTVGEIGVRPHGPDTDTAIRIEDAALGAGVPISEVSAGERRQAGDVSWTVLGPAPAMPPGSSTSRVSGAGDSEEEGSAENDASVVVLAEIRGVRVLLTGDIEPPSQQALLRVGHDLRATVLKVPHGTFT
ncbi:MAG: ComEC/Rec2 family competence protein, partial [Actinopolymorphaceae bacterium]